MLAGSLTEFGLADVFSLLASTRKTGSLNLEGPGVAGRVWIAGGGLCFALADTTRAPLAARLLQGGEVAADQVPGIVEAHGSDDPAAVHDGLVALGLPSERVRALLLEQVVDAVFDLSRWGEGTFNFDQRGDSDAVPVAAAADVLMQVEGRMAEWQTIVDRVPADDAVLALAGRPQRGAEAIMVDPAHWPVLTIIDGLRTTQEVVDVAGQGVFTGSRIVADLVGAGLVLVRDEPTPETATAHRARVVAEAESRLLGAAARPTRPAPQPVPQTAPAAAVSAPARAEEIPAPAAQDEPTSDQLFQDQPVQAGGHAQAAVDDLADLHATADQSSHAGAHDAPTYDAPAQDEPAHDAPHDAADGSTEAPADQLDPSSLIEADAPAPAAPAGPRDDEARRARELAALGLAPDTGADGAQAAQPTEEDKPLARDNQVNADLLARLIDGVKGG